MMLKASMVEGPLNTTSTGVSSDGRGKWERVVAASRHLVIGDPPPALPFR